MLDPYEYSTPDWYLWEELLDMARIENEYMFGILEWYRRVGCYLEESKKFGYIIKPIISQTKGWESEEEWLSEKQWLMPYWKTVAKLLKALKEKGGNIDVEF